jgi:DNA gyrase/topoisomerase IV subunit A
MKKNNIERWEMGKAIKSYYMPYAMKTIIDRALPDVRDGLKPIHRRIIYKMFDTGLSSKVPRAKCVSIVGDVLEIHGHGDSSVYDALSKLTEQHDGQLHPYIDGEGAFGKQYLTDKPSAMRYTFARLNAFSEEFIKDLNKNVVKFVGEKEHLQPLVLPVTFPNILIKQNEGIAVGMSCYFPSFNLEEIGKATIAYIKDPNVDLAKYILAPDFSTGGEIIYDEKEMRKIIDDGKGRLKVRCKYRYDKENNCIEIYQIPHNTTANAIIGQVTDMMKDGVKEVKDITDIRDETGFNKEIGKEELLITIDVKKNTDIEKLMSYLINKTTLSKYFTANLNCLVDYKPQVLGIKAILENWLVFRRECLSNALRFDIEKMEKQLHFLKGLEKVLLDIDKAIEIIRNSDEDEIVNKLCDFFKVDESQAVEIADMKLRFINKEYILNKIKSIKDLEELIKKQKSKVDNVKELNKDIIKQLEEIIKKYSKPRCTEILYDIKEISVTQEISNYNVMFFLTKEGYFKKIPLTSLKNSGEHKLKDGDSIIKSVQGQNTDEVLVFTNIGNVYRLKAHKVEDSKTSSLGLFLPSELNLVGEKIVNMVVTSYAEDENVLLFYKNGFIARVDIKAYQSSYSMLKGNVASEIKFVEKITDNIDLMLFSTEGKCLIFNTNEINTVNGRNVKGVKGMNLSSDNELIGLIINPVSKMKLSLTTNRKGTFELISDEYEYYKGSRGNIGVFIYNCRSNKDNLLNVEAI